MNTYLTINQPKSIEFGLTANEAFVFSWIYELSSWSDKVEMDGNIYYKADKEKALLCLPFVSKNVSTFKKLYTSLKEKELIDLKKYDNYDYISLTEKGKKWHYTDFNEDELENENKKDEKNGVNYKLIFDTWNEVDGAMYGEITKRTDKRRRAISTLIRTNNSSMEELIGLIKTLPYADKWVRGDSDMAWKLDFDWLLRDVSGWYAKALEGKMHKDNLDKFREIMGSNDVIPKKKDTVIPDKNGRLIIDGKEYK